MTTNLLNNTYCLFLFKIVVYSKVVYLTKAKYMNLFKLDVLFIHFFKYLEINNIIATYTLSS